MEIPTNHCDFIIAEKEKRNKQMNKYAIFNEDEMGESTVWISMQRYQNH